MSELRQQKVRKPRHEDIPAARALSMALLPELRQFNATNLEVRSAKDNGTDNITVSGVPIVYNAPYEVTDAFGTFEERMMPGVATDTMSSRVVFQFDHAGMPMASTSSGTMTMVDHPDGLHFEARLDPRQQLAQDLSVAIERGDIHAMSVSFSVSKDGQEWNEEMDKRTISRFSSMYDISAVTWPASPTTSITVAKRMALRAPIESLARLQNIAAEMRAGKVLSTVNQSRLIDALSAMQDVLGNSGYDLSSVFDDNDEDEAKEQQIIDPDGDGDDDRYNNAPLEEGEVTHTVHDEDIEALASDGFERSLDLAMAELDLLKLRRRH